LGKDKLSKWSSESKKAPGLPCCLASLVCDINVTVGWSLSNMFKMVLLIMSTSEFVLQRIALFAQVVGLVRHGNVESIAVCILSVVATKSGTAVMSGQEIVFVVVPFF
jgi:hypothetical protein